jgi:hypothetical protein
MAVVLVSTTSYVLQGDGVSTSYNVPLSWTPTTATILSQSVPLTGVATTNVTGITIQPYTAVIAFTPFTGQIQLVVSYDPPQYELQNPAQQPAFQSVVVPNPAPGANVSVTVPLNTQWTLRSIYVGLTTSATVGNRYLGVLIKDAAGNIMSQTFSGHTQAAGAIGVYTFGQGLTATTVDDVYFTAAMPTIVVGVGYTVEIQAVGIQAGDQISTYTLGVEATVVL